MGARVAWLYRNRIIHQQVYGMLTPDDVTTITDATQPLIADGEAPVHTLVDARFVEKFTTNISALKKAVNSAPSANLGWVIMIHNGNPVLKFMSSVLAQTTILNVRMRIFATTDEALRFLGNMDTTLGPDLLTTIVPDAPVARREDDKTGATPSP